MVTIPVSNPARMRAITTAAGAAVAVAAYFLPNLLPAVSAAAPFIPKVLWALGLFGLGGGSATIVQAPS